jgi:uncharacterized protein (DUF2126 family)
MKTYFVSVRVRKQDRNGNTYHDVKIIDSEGQIIADAIKVYGYDRQYETTTEQLLTSIAEEMGFEEKQYSNSYRESATKLAIEAGEIKLIYEVNKY